MTNNFTPPSILTLNNAKNCLELGLKAMNTGQSVVDFSNVTQADSSALAIMLTWQQHAKQKKITLQFKGLPSQITHLATIYGVSSLFNVNAS
jgi:phospholipid transport system transporter-binding protein